MVKVKMKSVTQVSRSVVTGDHHIHDENISIATYYLFWMKPVVVCLTLFTGNNFNIWGIIFWLISSSLYLESLVSQAKLIPLE
jgi:hypothetical protein